MRMTLFGSLPYFTLGGIGLGIVLFPNFDDDDMWDDSMKKAAIGGTLGIITCVALVSSPLNKSIETKV